MRFYGGGPVGTGNAGVFDNSVIGVNNNPLVDPRFKIKGGEPWNPTPLLPGPDTKKYENQQQFTVPRQLPSAGIGNVGGLLLAQAGPGMSPMGNAGALGGGMSMNSEQMQQMQMQGGPPIKFGVDIENEKVKNLRGSVNAQLDPNQSINFGGNYNVQDQSGQLGIGYRTPMFGFDASVTRTPRVNAAPAYGVQGNVMGRF